METQNIENLSLEGVVDYKVEQFIRGTHGRLSECEGLYKHLLGQCERALIKSVFEGMKQNELQAARVLGISRNTLREKLIRYGIKKKLGDSVH